MEVIKDPKVIMMGGLTVGWIGSTVYFYREIGKVREEIKQIVAGTNNLAQKMGAGLKDTNGKIELQATSMLDLLDSLESFMESREKHDLYVQNCFRDILKALEEKEIKISLPPAPYVDYRLSRKKTHRRRQIRQQDRQDRQDSDDESERRPRRQDRRDDRQDRQDRQDRDVDRQDRRDERRDDRRDDSLERRPSRQDRHLDPPPKQPAKQTRRRRDDDSESSEDVDDMVSKVVGKQRR